MRGLRLLLTALCLASAAGAASAHPVPSKSHDRTLLVRLTPDAVFVSYRLEVDPKWAAWELGQIKELDEERAKVRDEAELYALYRRYHADPIAYNLVARLDGRELTFRPVEGRQQATDHLRCEYTFKAAWKPAPGKPHLFELQDVNYEQDKGQFRAAVRAAPGVELTEVRTSSPEERLRSARARFEATPIEPRGADKPALPPDPATEKPPPRRPVSFAKLTSTTPESAPRSAPPPLSPTAEPDEPESAAPPTPKRPSSGGDYLQHLLFDTGQGVLMLLLLAAAFGAVHALTPGHGKTLVAAYLVGERGTTFHALILGLVTTLTHTSSVLVLAVLLWFFPGLSEPVQAVLPFLVGLLITGLGLWLLMSRLAGTADHVHVGGGHHHAPSAGGGKPSWGQLIWLGVVGGMIPCFDSVFLLGVAIAYNRLWLALPLILAFSVGLAATLVALGLIVVHGRRYAVRRWGDGRRMKRIVKFLTVGGAVLILAMGLWLSYSSVPK
jgi:ABC-type nickel/cobalt efflux system permease component RcnA